jgi:hypothetical protein
MAKVITRPKETQEKRGLMVPFGDYEFYKGIWESIKVTKVGPDINTPIEIRKSLVGLVVKLSLQKKALKSRQEKNFQFLRAQELHIPSMLLNHLELLENMKNPGS